MGSHRYGQPRRKKKVTEQNDRLRIKLMKYHDSDSDERITQDLPFQDEETAWRIFTILEMVEYRWTITDILKQPESLLDDVLQIIELSEEIKRGIS